MNYHNETSMDVDVYVWQTCCCKLPWGAVYIHYTTCLRVSSLYCWLNDSVQCALLESHFPAQHGGGGCTQKSQQQIAHEYILSRRKKKRSLKKEVGHYVWKAKLFLELLHLTVSQEMVLIVGKELIHLWPTCSDLMQRPRFDSVSPHVSLPMSSVHMSKTR